MQGFGAVSIAVLALAAAAPAGAQTRSGLVEDGAAVAVFRGERVVVRPAPDGRLVLVVVRPVPPQSASPPKPGARLDDDPTADTAPGTIALVLGGGPNDTTLKIESGLDLAFDYRAALFRAPGARPQPAKVCTVLPLLPGYETWPYPVASVVVGQVRTRTTNEVVCPPTPHPGKN